MRKSTGLYPSLTVDASGDAVVSHAGATLLVTTAGTVGLDRAMSAALEPWRKPMALHDPGKILLDLAIATAIGGDCLADIGLVRFDPAVFGLVASDPTVSRLFDTLAKNPDQVLKAIDQARVTVRGTVWAMAGAAAPDHLIGPKNPVAVDLDATLIIAHSEKGADSPHLYLLTELPAPVIVALPGFGVCGVYGRQPWSMRLMVSGICRRWWCRGRAGSRRRRICGSRSGSSTRAAPLSFR